MKSDRHSAVVYANQDLHLEDDIQLANAFSNLGVVKKQAGDLEKAASLHEKSIGIKRTYPIDQMAFLPALSHDNLGRVRELQGQWQTAAILFCSGSALLKAHSKETWTQHRMAQFTCSLGRVEAKLGQNIEAHNHLWEALALHEQSAGAFHPDFGLASYYLASFKLRQRMHDDAR